MRLYEFTDPTKYLQPEAHTSDLVTQHDDSKAADTTDIANRHLRTQRDTKEPTDT
jgi:hypothetical protein